MNLGLYTVATARVKPRWVRQLGPMAALCVAAINPVYAVQNGSGRYVVPAADGQWQVVNYSSYNGTSASFYPSWYAGVNIAQSEWKSGDFKQDSTGAGLAVGNHFQPQWRWEARHRYQDPISSNDSAGERHTLSSLAVDYIVLPPADGASMVLRAGMAQVAGDDLSSEQGDVQALLGLGLQWREGRWLARMLVEQMGENQRWAEVTLAGYFGGGVQKPRDKQAPVIETATAPSVVEPVSESVLTHRGERDELQHRSTDQAPILMPAVLEPQAVCGDVFATRRLDGIAFTGLRSSQLTDKSAMLLAQIGASYAKRSYIHVQLELSAANEALAESRSESVMKALNKSGALDRRIDSESLVGPDGVTLIMKDGRRCY